MSTPTGTTDFASAPPAPVVPHRGIITICVMLATLIQSLDSTIANVALPHMQGSLSASQDQITWVLTSIIGFTVASALCGVSVSLPMIIIARLLQGVFGASLVPLSQATLLMPEQRLTPARSVPLMNLRNTGIVECRPTAPKMSC